MTGAPRGDGLACATLECGTAACSAVPEQAVKDMLNARCPS